MFYTKQHKENQSESKGPLDANPNILFICKWTTGVSVKVSLRYN